MALERGFPSGWYQDSATGVGRGSNSSWVQEQVANITVEATAVDGSKYGDESIATATLIPVGADGAIFGDEAVPILTLQAIAEDTVVFGDGSSPSGGISKGKVYGRRKRIWRRSHMTGQIG